jgi:hypothetical protein
MAPECQPTTHKLTISWFIDPISIVIIRFWSWRSQLQPKALLLCVLEFELKSKSGLILVLVLAAETLLLCVLEIE